MWPYRRKSTINDYNNNNYNNNHDDDCSPKSRRAPSSPNFKRRSFKDIEILTHGDDNLSNFNTIEEKTSSSSQCLDGEVKRSSVFHRVHLANRFTRAFSPRSKQEPAEASSELSKLAGSEKPVKLGKLEKYEPRITIPGSEKRVVVYMTSLRAVRSTFEACRTVRSILQGFRVPVDERDLLMDASFFDEIRKIMAQIGQGSRDDKRVSLPRVFIGGRYIGGADEIVELHEMGELKKFVSGLPAVTPGVCEICGGFRFNLCDECNGSHKCPLEDGGFRPCTVCNENGLIRCPSCLSN
ncbi:hypothetical protein L1987_82527 [Smallanthus sonchifolius]|uniref:Uncharacterized protein n=1 Tax=Smallanthus sonchifolius TaxID=185202 RepID=A0ACB8YAM7_9ASTR|nr:hypothetical protein L1987_82527 [Smallanthus sonchifolius]